MGDGLPVLSEGTPRYTSSRWRLASALAADVLPQAPSNLHPCGGRAPLALAAYPSQPATHRHRGPAVRLPPQERWPVTWHGKRASRMTHPGPGGGGGSGRAAGAATPGLSLRYRRATLDAAAWIPILEEPPFLLHSMFWFPLLDLPVATALCLPRCAAHGGRGTYCCESQATAEVQVARDFWEYISFTTFFCSKRKMDTQVASYLPW
jgi:hypothetical protein